MPPTLDFVCLNFLLMLFELGCNFLVQFVLVYLFQQNEKALGYIVQLALCLKYHEIQLY